MVGQERPHPKASQHSKDLTARETLCSRPKMCYYDMCKWECGDWRWQGFRQHCEREYRMGETCGMKMIYATIPTRGVCKLCEGINTKKRKLEKASADYRRFAPDPARRATAEVKYGECLELQAQITKLEEERASRINKVGNPRRADIRA